ncbi:MAG: RnfABCDGE type electron transport complex subunit G [Candidatus Aureabacteria bacterium]|nr:RnfABCDGE type electron transport complex subunit G [Candidatus Auribacterota bacterium]
MRDVLKLTVLLTVVCLLNGLALGLVYEVTRGAIAKTAARTVAESLKLVVPQADRFSEKKECPLAGGRAIAYREAYSRSGELIGYALASERQGYQSVLKVLVGINPQGVIQGVKVLEQAETPGLGSRIDELKVSETIWTCIANLFNKKNAGAADQRPWFQEQYRGLAAGEITLLRPSQGGKGIHALTGATITSRALTQAVRDSIEAFLKARGARKS